MTPYIERAGSRPRRRARRSGACHSDRCGPPPWVGGSLEGAPGTGHAGGVVAVSPVLVGRAAEIAVLGESWALARGGSPATVLIGGEAGIGKTRLVGHFTADVEAEVLYGGCVDLSGGGLPFAPFTAALRGHADPPADLLPWGVQADSETARARLLRRCSHSSPACA